MFINQNIYKLPTPGDSTVCGAENTDTRKTYKYKTDRNRNTNTNTPGDSTVCGAENTDKDIQNTNTNT